MQDCFGAKHDKIRKELLDFRRFITTLNRNMKRFIDSCSGFVKFRLVSREFNPALREA
jgi:hypothetical protein